MVIGVLCLFFTVPWVGLLSVIVVFLGHTHLLSSTKYGEDGARTICSSHQHKWVLFYLCSKTSISLYFGSLLHHKRFVNLCSIVCFF